jgi:hypothetical protein
MTGVPNRLEIFIAQLDCLVVFLAAGHEEVFESIRKNKSTWFPSTQDPNLPDTFDAYRVSINHAAFLLGYAHFEAFLADMARAIYLRRPAMLSKARTLSFDEILNAATKDEIIKTIIDKEIRDVLYGKAEDIQKYFKEKMQIPWPEPDARQFVIASRIRNCLMHNGGKVDDRLAEVFSEKEICLSADKVHSFGISVRRLARCIWEEAEKKHFGN